MGEHNIVLKYRLIPTRITGEEAFKKLRTDRQTDTSIDNKGRYSSWTNNSSVFSQCKVWHKFVYVCVILYVTVLDNLWRWHPDTSRRLPGRPRRQLGGMSSWRQTLKQSDVQHGILSTLEPRRLDTGEVPVLLSYSLWIILWPSFVFVYYFELSNDHKLFCSVSHFFGHVCESIDVMNVCIIYKNL